MKRPARVPSQLSESLHKRLSAYALAASAAGVGVLALAQPAEARIVYTPIHHVIGPKSHYNLDLNNDGIVDFVISNTVQCAPGCVGQLYLAYAEGRKSIDSFIGRSFASGFGQRVFALRKETTIGASKHFSWASADNMAYGSLGTKGTFGSGGPWANVKNRYLGLRIRVGKERHYGWARLNVKIDSKTAKITATLTGYAYETIPNKKIIAGKTHGKNEATLGRLAQGASGVRQKQ
jgi:hypothetical protein